jgi:pimeloyl-ACP methyl ester carboxylesterase
MGRINLGRVLVGGLLAGVVINISEFLLNGVVFAEEFNDAMKAMNKPPIDNSMIVWFVLLGFGIGFMAVWLYAAMRPRMGAGPRTAACAGLVVWGLAYLYPNTFMGIMGLFPTRIMAISSVWGLVEMIVAGIAGAWLYTEV